MTDRLAADAEMIWQAFGEEDHQDAAEALDRLVAEVREHRALLERVRAQVLEDGSWTHREGDVGALWRILDLPGAPGGLDAEEFNEGWPQADYTS